MDALKGPGKSLSWSPALDSAFTRAKDLLSSILELVHPQPDAPISLSVDDSDTHLGAVLQQLLDGSWAPLAFYSKKLSDAEKKYSAFDCELLAAYSSFRHFRFMLEGREFTIFMDHKHLALCLGFLLPGPPVSRVISPTWRSSPAPLFTFLVRRMWWLTPYPDLLHFLLRLELHWFRIQA